MTIYALPLQAFSKMQATNSERNEPSKLWSLIGLIGKNGVQCTPEKRVTSRHLWLSAEQA